ncbi:Bax inhibitor-1/YccA family protein [Micavibrio aeruginosavorus]|uniref:Bax inhibitor-1/YccA family protein n=1 Tax=Micavibrio aeruginosavorus TaxID=349221 RepID=UPI003F4AD04F
MAAFAIEWREEDMQPDRFTTQTTSGAVAYDAGLRSHFQKVYNTMGLGLAVTGVTAYVVSSIEPLTKLLYGTPLVYVLAFLPLVFMFVGFNQRALMTKSAAQLTTLFYLFSAAFGLSLGSIFLVYVDASIAKVFFITAGMFAGTSIFGYTTKKDLSGLQGLLVMGVIGLLIAIVVNMFLQSPMMDFVISCVGVLVYTGLIAFDTQNIKEMYSEAHGAEANGKAAVMGALSLYVNFIMLFQFMLSLLGQRE